MLAEKRLKGNLLLSETKTIDLKEINGGACKYVGETDLNGNAFGLGVATDEDGNTFTGTFINNKMDGICVWHHKATGITDEGEYKVGR